jgi:hypothetical protein
MSTRQTTRIPIIVFLLFLAVGDGTALATGDQPIDLPDGASESWWATVRQDILESEYHVTWQDRTRLTEVEGAYQAPNRAQGFRVHFLEDGIRVVPRGAGDPEWTWGLSLLGWGRPGDRMPVEPVQPSPHEDRVDYWRDSIDEWYVNTPAGLEQGFTITSPPDDGTSDAPLHVDMLLTGTLRPILSEDGQAIDFATPQGVRVLHYSQLVVTDSGGRELEAWFEGFSEADLRGIRIAIDDRDAIYPVVIDPMATTPDWFVESNDSGTRLGYSVASAGDVNGDGFGDVIVGAPYYDGAKGQVRIYVGSAGGLGAVPFWSLNGLHYGDLFGRVVSAAGDVNLDGHGDVVVGAPFYEVLSQPEAGKIWVFVGGPSTMSPVFSVDVAQAEAHFGHSVAAAGDVNGDGYGDIVVGAHGMTTAAGSVGKAYVWHGPFASGSTADWSFEGDQVGGWLGYCVATAGDVNGDGYSDVVISARNYQDGQENEGRVYVFHGSATGLGASPAWTRDGDAVDAYFGESVATAGDVNGDGYSDVIVGAPSYTHNEHQEGKVYVYHGGASGLALGPAWTRVGGQLVGLFGTSVGTAGDVDGDGYSDVIVGERFRDNGEYNEGRAYVFAGTGSGIHGGIIWQAESNVAEASYGISAATAGDVNGDGYSDVIVGAPEYGDGQSYEGAVYVYHGYPDGLAPAYLWQGSGGQANGQYGFSVASAGDVNGDGYRDIIVGARLYDHGQTDEGRAFLYSGSASGPVVTPTWTAEGNQENARLGWSVAGAGDVDGDGYSEVIISAPYFDWNPAANEGRVMLWQGSHIFGLGADGTPYNADWIASTSQVNAYFGYAVDTAGDVNGDGYADVIIGTPYYDDGETDEGGIFVWLGSPSGLGLDGTPANADWRAHSDQGGARLGASASSAGDVNGDGVSDVISGAYLYDNTYTDEGAVFVWHGSALGLGEVGTPANADWGVYGGQAGAYLGFSAASAGDVDRDGYSDVVFGAHGYDGIYTDEGRVYVHEGSEFGLSYLASFGLNGGQAGAAMGYAAASAGDVNGDGYSDVVVGAFGYDTPTVDAGRFWVFNGSASGLSLFGFGLDGPYEKAWAGRSVAPAGDVNGDGYADVLIGIPGPDTDNSAPGYVSLYYGGMIGRTVHLRQTRPGVTVPVDRLGRADSMGGFWVRARGHGMLGRGDVKLEWEMKPVGVPFDGTGLQAVGAYQDTGTGFVNLAAEVAGLDAGAYHWRARVRQKPSTSPFQYWGRWVNLNWSGWNETDLRLWNDGDSDGLPDDMDNCPDEANADQADMDQDGDGDVCDIDVDGDGMGNESDCAPDDDQLWKIPFPAEDLQMSKAAVDNLTWTESPFPGGVAPCWYDVLVSSLPHDFGPAAASCIESDDTDLVATESVVALPGELHCYLVRAQNGCGGNLGYGSGPDARTGRDCP